MTMTPSLAHWPCAMVCSFVPRSVTLPSLAVNRLQTTAAPGEEGQSQGSSVTRASRKRLVTGRFWGSRANGNLLMAGARAGVPEVTGEEKAAVDELLGQNVPTSV